jgi:signal transduction histidine kinase
MVFRKFHIQTIIRVSLILANSAWLGLEIFNPPNAYTIVLLGSVLIIQSALLIRYVNRTNRELARYFASLRDQDSSFTLVPEDPKGSFSEVVQEINETRKLIQDARIDKEKQYRYLQIIINHMDIGLLSFRVDGSIEHYNRAARELLGTGQLTQLQSLNTIHPDLEIILQGMEPGQSKILSVTTASEKVRLLFKMSELVYEDHPLKLLSVQDVNTELDERELISWKRLIRVLNHEVMNSLTPIRTLTHAIDRSLQEIPSGQIGSDISEDIRENIRLIEKRSSSLVDFVNRYREITRINDLVPEEIKILNLLNDSASLYQDLFQKMQLDCQVIVQPSGLSLHGDPSLLKQVLINLLQNSMEALKKTPGGRIIVSAEEQGDQIVIKLTDNGPGIPSEYMEEIFTPFFSTRKDESGIGLSFSKHIIRLHGGTMSIWSRPGEGTTVTIKLRS